MKEILANKATTLLRGKQASEKARQAASDLFNKGQSGDNLENLPSIEVEKSQIDSTPFIDFLVSHHLFTSKGSCRKMIMQGGVKIDSVKVVDHQILLKVI